MFSYYEDVGMGWLWVSQGHRKHNHLLPIWL